MNGSLSHDSGYQCGVEGRGGGGGERGRERGGAEKRSLCPGTPAYTERTQSQRGQGAQGGTRKPEMYEPHPCSYISRVLQKNPSGGLLLKGGGA